MVEIKIEVPEKVVHYVDALLRTGLYGEDRETAVERLLCRAIEAALPLVKEP